MRVLLVEDEEGIAIPLRRALEREGHDVRHSPTGSEGVDIARSWLPEIVLLDVGLPDIPGTEVARQIRTFATTPIIMVTAMGETDDRVSGLDVGADDYVVKPFQVPELLARIRAVARRASTMKAAGTVLEMHDLVLDVDAGTAKKDGQALDLKDREFELLRLLMSRAGDVVRRDEITRALWGLSPTQAANSLDVHMSWLRSKLGDDAKEPRYIETVRGRGFRFIPS